MGLLRRRVVFELTAEQLPLLEQSEARHGSKRAALLAALAAEAGHTALQAHDAELEVQLEETRGRLARLEDQHAQATAELAEAVAKVAAHAAVLSAAKAGGKQLEAERKRAAVAESRAEQLDRQAGELAEALEQLEERTFDALFCARCGSWAHIEEWAYAPDGDGERCYHQPCGDHGSGMLGPSWLAWRAQD